MNTGSKFNPALDFDILLFAVRFAHMHGTAIVTTVNNDCCYNYDIY